MTDSVKLLILGTGEVGASIGLALRRAGENFQRIGYDPDHRTGQQAQRIGAIDRFVQTPGGAAREADLVVLTLPPTAALDAATAIAEDLRPDTVVLCTFRLQAEALREIQSALGPARPCLGAVPFLGPQRALASGGPGEPAADVFDGGMLGIVAPPGTPQGAIEICLDLAAILRATPFFLDSAELDSVTATSEEFPALLAAALMESLPANPGWRDQRRLVGRPFARLAGLLEGLPAELAAEWIANRQPLLARLDALSEELAGLRDLLSDADEGALAKRLAGAVTRYEEWRAFRAEARPDLGVELVEMPRLSLFDRLLGGRPARKTGR